MGYPIFGAAAACAEIVAFSVYSHRLICAPPPLAAGAGVLLVVAVATSAASCFICVACASRARLISSISVAVAFVAVALALVSGRFLTADMSPPPTELSSKLSASIAAAYSTRASYSAVGAAGGAGGIGLLSRRGAPLPTRSPHALLPSLWRA